MQDPDRGRPRRSLFHTDNEDASGPRDSVSVEELEDAERSYIDLERRTSMEKDGRLSDSATADPEKKTDTKGRQSGQVVDVILSDMSVPWHLTSGQWIKSVSDPHRRMMNTSGVAFRDHAGSMDLCLAALSFSFDVLKAGGHFVCKFYQGAEDKSLEKKLRAMFEKVHREKPEASRDVSGCY